MAGEIPFASGRNAQFVFVQDNNTVSFLAKSWKVKENATLVADDVGGEKRSRLQKIVNFYEWSIEAFVQDLKQLQALLADTAKIDSMTAPLDNGCGVTITTNDGARTSFAADGFVIDDWEFAMSGRTDRLMITVPGRSQTFVGVPSV